MSKTVDELMRLHLDACNAWTEVAQHSDGFEAATTADAALRSALEAVAKDAELLDYLDARNARKNQQNGTTYGWRLTENHNRIALEDHYFPQISAREAIDAAMQQAPEQEAPE
jgi:hypothetical protein